MARARSAETSSQPAYFERSDAFLVLVDPPSFARYTGRTNVRDGHGVVYLQASDLVEVGDRAEITLELRPPAGAAFGSSVDAVAVPFPEAAGTEPGRVRTPNINPQWVHRGDDFWLENDWDDSSVARVVRSEGSIEIYVSADNRRLNRLIARAQRRSVETVDALKDFYLEHLSFHALLADIDRERTGSFPGYLLGSPDIVQLERERDLELQRACETVCGIIEESFEFFAARDSGSS